MGKNQCQGPAPDETVGAVPAFRVRPEAQKGGYGVQKGLSPAVIAIIVVVVLAVVIAVGYKVSMGKKNIQKGKMEPPGPGPGGGVLPGSAGAGPGQMPGPPKGMPPEQQPPVGR